MGRLSPPFGGSGFLFLNIEARYFLLPPPFSTILLETREGRIDNHNFRAILFFPTSTPQETPGGGVGGVGPSPGSPGAATGAWAPSLCQLFQKGQCRADQRCNQLHVSPHFIRALRRAMAAVPYVGAPSGLRARRLLGTGSGRTLSLVCALHTHIPPCAPQGHALHKPTTSQTTTRMKLFLDLIKNFTSSYVREPLASNCCLGHGDLFRRGALPLSLCWRHSK